MNVVSNRALQVVLRGMKSVYEFTPEQMSTIEEHFRNWVENYTTYTEEQSTKAWVKYVELNLPPQYFKQNLEERKAEWLQHLDRIKKHKLDDYK